RDGLGVFGTLEWTRPNGLGIVLQGAGERRQNDQYLSEKVSNKTLRFNVLTRSPVEERSRLVGTIRHDAPDGSRALFLRLGAERVTNFGSVHGADRTSAIAELSLSYYP
ncbi:MAG: hypothetical protein H0W68_11465, partial [Gemmatimonadaceae bacterium]|nr:hypothetical protein [Gemmatimonadaceae bacterium]